MFEKKSQETRQFWVNLASILEHMKVGQDQVSGGGGGVLCWHVKTVANVSLRPLTIGYKVK